MTETTQSEPAIDIDGRLRPGIRDIPDYPSPGVMFKDITPLLADRVLFAEAVAALATAHGSGASAQVDLVAGIEARGFIFAAPVALALGAGFVPIRKSGKLPHTTVSADYALEYGTATIEVHADAVRPGQRVLLLDDVLATGGTAAAAAKLLEDIGAEVVALSFLIELDFLGGRERLPGREIHSLVRY
ncbi:MAG TPA: adenine phosphoribosyltransferase [Kineosporiaceae bacterium]|nr:adenine phosphoribosyltransferase [Kineosporiaceae bacterium]